MERGNVTEIDMSGLSGEAEPGKTFEKESNESSTSPEKQKQEDHYEQDHERSWPNKPSSTTAVATDEHAA